MLESATSYNIPDVIESDMNNVLYVDDEQSNLRVFDSVFSRYYNVFTATSGKMAIKLLHEYEIHMIITDQKMPEMTGTDLLERTLNDFPDIIRIILTGFADIQAIIKAINKCSIYKYVTKPYENSEMREIIDRGLEIYNMRKKKYNGSPFFSENGSPAQQHLTDTPAGTSLNGRYVDQVLADVSTGKEQYETFLENGISYQFRKKDPLFFKDFYIHSDEDSVKLYHINFKIAQSDRSAMVYMHLKLRLREILMVNDNKMAIQDLHESLEQFYVELSENISISDLTIISYDWDSGKMEILTKELKARIYNIELQFEEVKLPVPHTLHEGYLLYSFQSKGPLMVYGWGFEPKEGSNRADIVNNIKLVVSNATDYPIDIQENKLTDGLRSISDSYKDLIFYGLHITD